MNRRRHLLAALAVTAALLLGGCEDQGSSPSAAPGAPAAGDAAKTPTPEIH